MEESAAESPEVTMEKAISVLQERLKVEVRPKYVMRIGKAEPEKKRLILVKMERYDDKVKVMKSARFLRGSGLFIMDDLSKKERESRRVRVKKARSEGKKAFIRFSDGKLIVNGEVQAVTPSSSSQSQSPIPDTVTLSE